MPITFKRTDFPVQKKPRFHVTVEIKGESGETYLTRNDFRSLSYCKRFIQAMIRECAFDDTFIKATIYDRKKNEI